MGRHSSRPSQSLRAQARARRAGNEEVTIESAPSRYGDEVKRRTGRAKRIALYVVLGIVGVLLLTAASAFAYLGYLQDSMNKGVGTKKTLELKLEKAQPLEPYTILLMGFDKRKGETVYRSDTMIVAKVDAKKKKIWMFSIPRDYRVDIPGHGINKINAAYQKGQEQLAIDTVEEFTGIKINHFMGVDFKGFRGIVDAMGGVKINVEWNINDKEADQTKGNTASVIKKGEQVLDGEHALTYVRTRHTFADGDFQRMTNQQTFFKAIADQAAEMSITQLIRIVTAACPYLGTDMSLTQLMRTARDMKNIGSKNIYSDNLPGEWKSPYVWPDEAGYKEVLKRFKAGKALGSEAIAAEEAAEAEKAADNVSPVDVKVEIRNGSGRSGVGAQASSLLQSRGFIIGEVGNIKNEAEYPKTLVVYKENAAAAALVARYLQPGVKYDKAQDLYQFEGEVLIVIGDDWNLEKVPVTDGQ